MADTKSWDEGYKLGFQAGFSEGIRVARLVADWLAGQDKKKAMEHIERECNKYGISGGMGNRRSSE